MGVAGRVITKWFIAASVKPAKSQSQFVECAIFRNVHGLCKLVMHKNTNDCSLW